MSSSGIYFRVRRNTWEAVAFEDLTVQEREEVMMGKEREFLMGLAQRLADAIVELENEDNE